MGTNKPTLKIDREEVISLLISHRPFRNMRELNSLNSKILAEMLASDYKLLSDEWHEKLRTARDIV